MAFACVYLLAQQDEHSSAKNAGKERAETGFRLIWNNYQSTTGGLPRVRYPGVKNNSSLEGLF